ncbi:hypothetical protein KO317_02645 [Candidatus Micrarchaeota archaeon]|jgi:hypothetical protein|nr:hypothetical protein [Candidatus Micrarchaeota archaeon]
MKLKNKIVNIFINKDDPWWLKYDFLIFILFALFIGIYKWIYDFVPYEGLVVLCLLFSQNLFKLSYWAAIQKNEKAHIWSMVPCYLVRKGEFYTIVSFIFGLIFFIFALVVLGVK